MNKREPIAWMVYTVDGQSAYVTDNPSDIKEGQSAYALYPGPFEQILLTEEEIDNICRQAHGGADPPRVGKKFRPRCRAGCMGEES